MMIIATNGKQAFATNQTPYTEEMADSAYVCGATFMLENTENYELWLAQQLQEARDAYHLNTITVYGLENYDDAYKAALFSQLKRLDMKICVRIEGYDADSFAFTKEDAAAVMSRYKSLVEFTCQPEYRDTVYYYALNMPVDDPAVQENLGGVNSDVSKANQVSYAEEIVRLMRQYTAENGYANAKLYLSVFYGWDATYDIPSYVSAGADGYFINNYTYPAGTQLTGAGGNTDDILNTARLSRTMDLFVEDYPNKPPLVVESGFHTLEYNNGQWPAQTAGLVLDRETKAVAMKALVEFYAEKYPFVEGLMYFGYNLFKEEGEPPAVMDWALKYPTEDKTAGTVANGITGINLMDNAGFENSTADLPGWGKSDTVSVNTDTAYTHSGAVSAKVAAGHTGEAYAYCNTTATYDWDAAFTAGMWVYLENADDAFYVTVYLERPGSTGGTVTAKPEAKTGWQRVTVQGTATEGTTRQAIKFVVREGNTGDIYFDDSFLYCDAAESINLIRNCGFDSSKNTWEDDTAFEIATDVYRSGTGSAKLIGARNIYQASGWWPNKSSIDSGDALYYSAWVKGGENAGTITLRAEVKCGPTKNYDSETLSGAADGWQLLTVRIPYPDLTVSEILFHITTTGEGTFYVDDVKVNAVEQKAVLHSRSIALGDDLDMRFYVRVADTAVENTAVSITVAEKTVTYPASKAEKAEETGDRIFTVSLSAAQMTEPVTVELSVDGTVLQTGTYSVRQYADAVLSQTTDEKLIALIRAMLDYGAAAQAYFGYNTDAPANAGMESGAQTVLPQTADARFSVTGAVSAVRFYGSSVVFESKTGVRFYFAAEDLTGCTFAAGGSQYTPVAKNGMYYVEISGINPRSLSKEITLTVTDGLGTMSVTYSPMHYIVRMGKKGTEKMQVLVKAFYQYHLAACEAA